MAMGWVTLDRILLPLENAARRTNSSAIIGTTIPKPDIKTINVYAQSRSCSTAQTFKVSPERGFLPVKDPLVRLTRLECLAWEETLHEIPKLLVASEDGHKLRRRMEKLPSFAFEELLEEGDGGEIWRAMLVLSFMAHAYIWGGSSPVQILPRVLSLPLCAVARSLDMPPVLTYATYNLLNWRVLDADLPIQLGNIVCLNNFYGGLDEEWFRLVHVEIEAKAGVGLKAMLDAQDAVAQQNVPKVQSSLIEMIQTLKMMQKTLSRMGEKCDPYIYYHRIRRFMSGWRGNPVIPNGMLYDGVWNEPKCFYGETGAQSPIIPAFDAALGVTHPCGPLSDYLQVMHLHMPLSHRSYIQCIEAGPSIRSFVIVHISELGKSYDACLTELFRFRALHMNYASTYIKQPGGIDEKGTGGTDFIPYLLQNAMTTKEYLLSASGG